LRLTQADEVGLKDEISILKPMRHHHIIRLHEVFEDKQFYYLVTEMMTGGELFDKITEKEHYTEKEARAACKFLFQAIQYCHSHKVAHRDLKPENLLLSSKSNDYDVKLADFGFAKRCESPDSLRTRCGTLNYAAPEVLLSQGYDTRADMWSIGVIVYILIGGHLPFDDKEPRILLANILEGRYTLSDEHWVDISQDAKDMIKLLLEINPKKRISADKALECKWMQHTDRHLRGRHLRASLIQFKKFNAKRKFKSAVDAVIASNRLNDLVKDMVPKTPQPALAC